MRLRRRILRIIATRQRWHWIIVAGVAGVILIQILAFSPSRLEQDLPPAQVSEAELRPPVETTKKVLPALPKDRTPEYTIDDFQYVSVQKGQKQWKLNSKTAYFYQKEGLTHSKDVTAYLYGADGRITVVKGNEALYLMQSRDMELFGNVSTTFPDGLVVKSEYMKYTVADKSVRVPIQYLVTGDSVPQGDPKEQLHFTAMGLTYEAALDRVLLLDQVHATLTKAVVPESGEPRSEVTQLDADLADLSRRDQIARFSMRASPDRKLTYVHIEQPGMKCRSRRAEFLLNPQDKKLRTMRALEEVKIEETPKEDPGYATDPRRRHRPSARFSTSGVAEFDSYRNTIVLRDYPQVYQDRDTITGDTVIVHRDTDIVEVEESNAYTDGKKNP